MSYINLPKYSLYFPVVSIKDIVFLIIILLYISLKFIIFHSDQSITILSIDI